MCFSPQRCAMLRHPNFKKCSEDCSFLTFSLPKCAFRHSGVQCCDIRTSKVLPGLQFTSTCAFRHVATSELQKVFRLQFFKHFHFQICFSPQRRAMLRHPTSKRAPRTTVFSPFSLPLVLFATAACNVATSDLRKVLGGQKFCHIFTSKCAFCHSGVQCCDTCLSPQRNFARSDL